MIDTRRMATRVPVWIWMVAAFGTAWNAFGIVQLADFVTQTRTSLMMNGMSSAAADLYYGLPAWMAWAFAIGSGGGLAGSITLAWRPRVAVPVLWSSLLGYIALYVGDYTHGVFAAVPGQMAVLSFVVLVAVALLATAVFVGRRS